MSKSTKSAALRLDPEMVDGVKRMHRGLQRHRDRSSLNRFYGELIERGQKALVLEKCNEGVGSQAAACEALHDLGFTVSATGQLVTPWGESSPPYWLDENKRSIYFGGQSVPIVTFMAYLEFGDEAFLSEVVPAHDEIPDLIPGNLRLVPLASRP